LQDNLPHHLSGAPPDFVRHPAQSVHLVLYRARGLRPRPPSCPIRQRRARTRLSAEVGRHARDYQFSTVAPPTSGGASGLDLLPDRCSCQRCDRRAQLAASAFLPVRVRDGQQKHCRVGRSPRRRAAPPILSFPCCIHHGRMRPNDCRARPGLPHRGWGESAEAWPRASAIES
jgi:hypothetical protein